MRRSSFAPEPDCAIAQSLGVIGDGWELLIVRDLARGLSRFDELADSLRISRKVLTERLTGLVDSQIVDKVAYQDRPTRYVYRLTPRGRALLPVLVALQDWGDRWLLGDGSLTGTNVPDEPPAQRLHQLVGQRLPYVDLPSTAGTTTDVLAAEARATVVFGYPATGRPTPLPDGWSEVAGAAGCTLENRLFAARHEEFTAKGIAVHGVSTQRPDEQLAFAQAEDIPHLLLSDLDLHLAAALRLPTFRAGGYERLKRVVLIVDASRMIRAVRYPVTDIADTVAWALTTA